MTPLLEYEMLGSSLKIPHLYTLAMKVMNSPPFRLSADLYKP